MNHPLNPPPGTRFMEPSDRGAKFEPTGFLGGRVDFEEMFQRHSPSRGEFTLLRIFEGQIVAAASFRIRADDIFVDFLSRNASFESGGQVEGASVLVRALTGFCRALGAQAIRLDCVNDQQSLAWYVKLGFAPDGEPYEEPGRGLLRPMVLWLSPPGRP